MDSSSSESDWSSDGEEGRFAWENSGSTGSGAGPERAAGVSTSLPLRGPMEGRPRGTLRLDKTEARSGEKVGVYWNVPLVLPDARDWIGLYETGAFEECCFRRRAEEGICVGKDESVSVCVFVYSWKHVCLMYCVHTPVCSIAYVHTSV